MKAENMQEHGARQLQEISTSATATLIQARDASAACDAQQSCMSRTCTIISRVDCSVVLLPGSHTTAAVASATAMLSRGAARAWRSTRTSAAHLQRRWGVAKRVSNQSGMLPPFELHRKQSKVCKHSSCGNSVQLICTSCAAQSSNTEQPQK
jgi:hypothetical protein